MAQWKFQIYPAQPDLLGHKFAIDSTTQEFADQVNSALRYPFRFHKVNKLCICIGPSLTPRPEYKELLGVSDKHCPNFSLSEYVGLSAKQRTLRLEAITKEVFHWLLKNFDDANFILVGARNMGWLEFPAPTSRPTQQPRSEKNDA